MNQGEKIINIIKDEGYKISSVAKKLDISRQALSRWTERETIPIETVEKLSRILKRNLLAELYPKYLVEQKSDESNEPELMDHIIDKYRFEGKVLQLEKMLKNRGRKEVEEIVNTYKSDLQNINRQLDNIQKQLKKLSSGTLSEQ